MGRPRFQPGEVTRVPWVNLKDDICHEYDDYGNHRITIKGAVGEWADYSDIATFKLDDRLFAATSDHWMSDLPEIFEIQTILPRTLSDVYTKETTNGGG